MKHSNVAIFVPHIGCPHKCSFCNQNTITQQQFVPDESHVLSAIETALNSLGDESKNAEIAFFGGSFTAIDRDYMLKLLNTAEPFVKNGSFHGIRISTRPDCIDDDILYLLKEKGVTAIELGAQSMSDEVLTLNSRGHTANDVISSSSLIKAYGFSLGLQMMTGLYGSSKELDIYTAKELASLKPDTMRIYPTVVLKNTALGYFYKAGKYNPPDTEASIELCSELLDFFESQNIKVIRLGLHDGEALKKDRLAGAYHPAFRELCESSLFFSAVCRYIKMKSLENKNLLIYVNPRDISKFNGQKKINLKMLSEKGYNFKIIQDSTVDCFTLKIKVQEETEGKSHAVKIFGNTRL